MFQLIISTGQAVEGMVCHFSYQGFLTDVVMTIGDRGGINIGSGGVICWNWYGYGITTLPIQDQIMIPLILLYFICNGHVRRGWVWWGKTL